jgi:PII-like signaling protein
MRTPAPAKMLRVHVSERDRYEGKPLYEAIVRACREMEIAGATVLRGLEGYGETGEMHQRHVGSGNEPIVIVLVDTEERIRACMPRLEQMMSTGLMALSDVEMIRVREPGPPAA